MFLRGTGPAHPAGMEGRWSGWRGGVGIDMVFRWTVARQQKDWVSSGEVEGWDVDEGCHCYQCQCATSQSSGAEDAG